MKKILVILFSLTTLAMERGSWKVQTQRKKKEFSTKELIEITKEQFNSIPKDPTKLSHEELITHYKEMSTLLSMLITFGDPNSPMSKKSALYLDNIKE